VNQQVKAGLSAIKDFLAGRSTEAEPAALEDKESREVVAAELVAAMAGPNAIEETSRPASADVVSSELDIVDPNTEQSRAHEATQSANANAVIAEHSETSTDREQERARQLFFAHGYFDEAVHNLRAANSPADRAAAARALGLVGSRRATAHLIAAMFDEDPEVRGAAEDAIRQIDDPTVGNLSAEVEVSQNAKQTSKAATRESSQTEQLPRVESQPVQIAGESIAVAIDPSAGAPVENEFQEAVVAGEAPHDLNELSSATTASEADQLLIQERSINQTVAEIGRQVLDMTTAFKQLEDEARSRTEREAQLRAEALARRSEEEDERKRAEEAIAARRAEEREALKVEQVARAKAEAEAQRLADEETKLRLKAASLRLDAAEVARRRADMEIARKEAAEAARQAEARRERDEARSRHEAELQRLRNEEQALQHAKDEARQQQTNLRVVRERLADDIQRLKEEQAAAEAAQREEADLLRTEAERRNTEAQEQLRFQMDDLRRAEGEVARRRAEVEAAREKADAETHRLLEAQARMRTAEEARAEAERERARLEAEINQQVEAQVQLLEDIRRRGQLELERVQEGIRLNTEREQQRLGELELMKTRAEIESAQRVEKERQILAQIDSLRIADAETRRRIEDAEVRRRATEDAYRLVAEKVQRVEAEAHAREKEEERMLAKLEAERRTVAIEAQSRAEQEKRIREEIAMFRRLEEEQRPLIEKASLELADIENRLQERNDQLREQEEARALAEEKLIEHPSGFTEELDSAEVLRDTIRHTVFPSTSPAAGSQPGPLAAEAAADLVELDTDAAASVTVTPAIATYLKSVDPYKRAAAVAELARTGSADAFSRITDCFDDPSPHVRNAAARALRKLEPERTVDLFNRALETGSPERRHNIGAAIAASGVATEAIDNLISENREDTYNALSILFVMAKTGEFQPLVQAIETHESVQVRMAAIKLLTLSGQTELANAAAKRRLEERPPENDHWS
jgi:hypothetical protein